MITSTYIISNRGPHSLLVSHRNPAKVVHSGTHITVTEGAGVLLLLVGVAVLCVHSPIVLYIPVGEGGITTSATLRKVNKYYDTSKI